MGFWDRIKGIGKPKRQGTGLELSRWTAPPPRRGTIQLLGAYREIPWLQTVVGKIGDNVANVHWRVYRRTAPKTEKVIRDYSLRAAPAESRRERLKALKSTGELIEVPDHTSLKVLADPNDYLSGRSITKLLSIHLDLIGETFLVLERSAGVVVGFWPVPPSWVMRLPRLDMPREQRTYGITVAGKSAEIPAADVIHLRHLDPDDPLGRGIGPGFALGDELDTDEYAARFLKSYFFNHAIPAAIIAVENMPNGDTPQAKAFKESLFANHQGPENAGRVMITGGKTSVSRLDTTFRDMGMVELRKFLKDFVRQVYGIPPEILGDVSSSNRATAQASQAILAEQVISPRMEFLRAELQRSPLFGPDDILEFDSPIPSDRQHELAVATAAPWSRSVNEWRELQGLRPVPEFDGVYPPLAMPGQVEPGKKPGAAEDPAYDPPEGDEAADPAVEDVEEEEAKRFASTARDPAWATQPLKLGH